MGRKAKKNQVQADIQSVESSEEECIGLIEKPIVQSAKSSITKKRTRTESLGFVGEVDSECSQSEKRQRLTLVSEASKTTISKKLSSEDLEMIEIQKKREQKEQDKIRKQRLYAKVQKQFQDEKSNKFTQEYHQLIKQSKQIKQKELGFVQTAINTRNQQNRVEKKELPFQNICDLIIKKQTSPISKNLTSEEIQLQKLQEHGNFKARPFKDNFDIFSSKLENQSIISKSIEFKEFQLKTQNLESTRKYHEKIEQIKREEAAKYEYKPFKALKFNRASIIGTTENEHSERKSAPPVTPSGRISCSASAISDLQRHDRQSMPPPTASSSLFKAKPMPNFGKIHQKMDCNDDLKSVCTKDSSVKPPSEISPSTTMFKAQEPLKVKQFLQRKFQVNPARQSITVPNQPILQVDEQKRMDKNNMFRLNNKNKYQEPEYMEFKF